MAFIAVYGPRNKTFSSSAPLNRFNGADDRINSQILIAGYYVINTNYKHINIHRHSV
jgi:hypothetical protein